MKSVKSAFACIRFLIINATRYNADDSTFDAELQQLGLPKEHSAAVCRVRAEHSNTLTAYLEENSLKGSFKFNKCNTKPR